MQLFPVDESPGGHIADLGVVLPAVPQPAQHLDVVGGLGHQVVRALGDLAATEVGGGVASAGDLDADPRPSRTDVVQGGDGLRQMKRLGMGGDRGRHQPDVVRSGGRPGGDQHRVETSANPVGAVIGTERVVGLQREPVFERDEVQKAPLGLEHQVGPVTRRQQLGGAGLGLAPCGRVPARPVQRDRQVQVVIRGI